MNQVQLEFRGTSDAGLLIALLAGVALMTLAWGVWQLTRRRLRYGLMCTAAAGGALSAIPALLTSAAQGYWSGNPATGRRALLASAAVAAVPILGLLVLYLLTFASLLWHGLGPGASLTTSATALAGAMNFADGGLWLLAMLVQVSVAAGAFYTAVYGYLGLGRLGRLLALRVVAILLLLLVLFKPAVAVTRGDQADKPYLTVLVDRSGSMGIIDQGQSMTRWQRAIRRLQAEQARLADHFRVVYHHFEQVDRQSDSLAQMARLRADVDQGPATDLAGPLRNASAAFPAARAAGIILLSDGADNVNARDQLEMAASRSAVPIYALGVGSTEENPAAGPPRMDIAAVEAPIQAVVRNTMHMQVTVNLTGKARRTHRLKLLDAEGQELAAQDVWTDQPAAEMTFQLPYTPEPSGASQEPRDVRKLRVVLQEKTRNEAELEPAQAHIHLLLTSPEIRVVYLEGSIRPEYKFLRRYFDSDPNLQLMALIRMTGSRFWAQGSLGKAKLTHLPADEEDFSLFDVLVIGDLDASYLTAEQMKRIDGFVEDGGGLLMIGGRSSFGPGGYGRTAIESALPVVMGPRGIGQETEPFVPQLTAAGQGHPIFQGISGFFRGPRGRAPREEANLPPLQGCIRTIRAKARTALAIHPDRRNQAGPLTVLAVQRYGAGRSAAFTGDTTWNWYLQMRGMGARSPYARFWGQLIRWLAGGETAKRDAQPAVVARLSPTRGTYRVGNQITLRCRVRNASGQTAPDAVVTATASLEHSELPPRVIPLAYSAAAETYEGRFLPDRDGQWNLEFVARSDETRLGRDTLPVSIEAHRAELERTARRQDLLAELADRSGGQSLELGRLGALVDELIALGQSRRGAAPQTDRASLHPLPLLFILFCAALTVEWLLRRRWQLA